MSTEKGVKLDEGKPRLDLVLGDFADALWCVGAVGTYGANKYTDKGWQEVENGIERYGNAMLRHYLNYRKGLMFDGESGLAHLGHMAWNALAMLQLYLIPHMTPECNIPLFKDAEDYIPGSIVEVPVGHADFKPIFKDHKDIVRCEIRTE